MRGSGVPEWVIETARRHVADHLPVPGFRLVFHFRQRVARGWYFWYDLERLPGYLPDPYGAGGAAGFIVRLDGSVEAVSGREVQKILDETVDGS
jgi:hypothetical protein